MKAIIHAGMSKTGSSSIQQTFVKLKHPDILYPGGGSGNHSALTALLFKNNPHKYPGFKARGLTAEELEVNRVERKAEILRNVAASSAKTFVMSSEQISSLPRGALRKIRHFAMQNFDDYQVIAYVRSPISYMTSVFQQRLKGNLTDLELIWPKYRMRFEVIDEVFGREKVLLRKFDRNLMHKGDVVSDFSKLVGVDIDDNQIVRKNESLSLEATALLFVQRKYGQGFQQGSQMAVGNNFQFTGHLRTIGQEKLQFSEDMLNPIVDANIDDLKWIEDRLGLSMLDSAPQTGTLIGSEKDLIDVAWETNKLIGRQISVAFESTRPGNLDDLVRNVELLRTLTAYDKR